MKNNYSNPKGVLLTLSFIGLFFISLIVILVADVEISSFFEDQVNSAINTEVEARVGRVSNSVSKGGSISNSIMKEIEGSGSKK